MAFPSLRIGKIGPTNNNIIETLPLLDEEANVTLFDSDLVDKLEYQKNNLIRSNKMVRENDYNRTLKYSLNSYISGNFDIAPTLTMNYVRTTSKLDLPLQ